MLPLGQKYREDFPRFGLPDYAKRFPTRLNDRSILIKVNQNVELEISDVFADLSRTSMQADFHCVTTWTYPNAKWSGVRFIDFFQKHIAHHDSQSNKIVGAVLYAQDGYTTTLLIEDLLNESVLLADSLDGHPLTIEHGAPLRLVAPKHYGYKNLKHLSRIEFYSTVPVVKRGIRAFLDHPRARVQREERGKWFPGWLLRYIYRKLIPGTVKEFKQAMKEHKNI